MRVGYELALIISYPTSTSGIIVSSKTLRKYREFFPTLFVKTSDFHLVFNFEQTRTVDIFGGHAGYNGQYTMMAKPIGALELHYPIIQFFIILLSICHEVTSNGLPALKFLCFFPQPGSMVPP